MPDRNRGQLNLGQPRRVCCAPPPHDRLRLFLKAFGHDHFRNPPTNNGHLTREEVQAMLAACAPGSTDFLAVCDRLTRRKLATLCRAWLAQNDLASKLPAP